MKLKEATNSKEKLKKDLLFKLMATVGNIVGGAGMWDPAASNQEIDSIHDDLEKNFKKVIDKMLSTYEKN